MEFALKPLFHARITRAGTRHGREKLNVVRVADNSSVSASLWNQAFNTIDALRDGTSFPESYGGVGDIGVV